MNAMFTEDDVKSTKGFDSEWWVFPDGFHANKVFFPTKESAIEKHYKLFGGYYDSPRRNQ